MEKLVYGLEKMEEIKAYDVTKDGITLHVYVVASLDGQEVNYRLVSKTLSFEKQDEIETAAYYCTSYVRTKILEGYGHGWKNIETGEVYDTCEGRMFVSSIAPGALFMVHYVPNKGDEYVLYITENLYERGEKIYLQSIKKSTFEEKYTDIANLYCYSGSEACETISAKNLRKLQNKLKTGAITVEEFHERTKGKKIVDTAPVNHETTTEVFVSRAEPVAKPEIISQSGVDLDKEFSKLRQEKESAMSAMEEEEKRAVAELQETFAKKRMEVTEAFAQRAANLILGK